MSELKRISISLEDDLLKVFDDEIVSQGYPTRSEAIKAIMRRSLVEQEWTKNQVVAGALTLVYDHHHSDTAKKIMSIQHDFIDVVITTQHVHLDHDNCLEIVVVKGKASKIKELASVLKSVKGIKHDSLVMSSVGNL